MPQLRIHPLRIILRDTGINASEMPTLLLIITTTFVLSLRAASAADDPCLSCHVEMQQPPIHEHRALSLGCEACHVRIHGKDHPGDRDSVRLKRDMPDLCFSCHKKTKFQNKELHAPVASGNCAGCHNPHGSTYDMILAREYPELCYACHSKEKFNKKYVHKIIMHRCSCHDPHVSEHPHLLYAPVIRVCTDCHRAKQSGRHVVTSLPGAKVHPVDGVPDPRDAKKLITCTTCHNPHSSEYRNLFPKPRICKMCHKYY